MIPPASVVRKGAEPPPGGTQEDGAGPHPPAWKKWATLAMIACCAGTFIWLLAANIRSVLDHPWHFSPPLLLSGIVCIVVAMHALPVSTRLILARLGYPLPWLSQVRAHFITQLAKYIPGGIWNYVGMAAFYRQSGIPYVPITVCFVFETLLLVLSSLCIGLPFLRGLLPAPFFYLLIAGIALPIGAVLFTSRWTGGLLVRVRLLPPGSEAMLHRMVPAICAAFLLDCLFWLLVGLGMWLVICGSTESGRSSPIEVTSAYAVAWTAGFLSFVVPGGIGVREGAFLLMLKVRFPLEIAAALAVLSRCAWMLSELLCIASSQVIIRLRTERA